MRRNRIPEKPGHELLMIKKSLKQELFEDRLFNQGRFINLFFVSYTVSEGYMYE